jgi:hypothetical protein
MSIPREFKEKLGELLATGHRKFGKVTPRKPYREDEGDVDSGAGSPNPMFEAHPFFAEQPVGASSDLTAIITENRDAVEEAEKRSEQELSHRLTQALKNKHTYTKSATPKMNPI